MSVGSPFPLGLVFLLSFCFFVSSEESPKEVSAPSDKRIAYAVIESCGGWRLNRLPEVKKFIFQDVPLFHNVEFKQIAAAPPDLVFLNKDKEEVERLDLSEKSQKECNQLLLDRGFYKKEKQEDEVPVDFLHSPHSVKDTSDL